MEMTRRTGLTLAAAVLLASFWAVPALARDVRVVRTEAATLEGELVSDDAAGVTLRISGISTFIKRETIKEVVYLPGIEDEYEKKRAAIKDDDAGERYKLALWLRDQKAYKLAKKELDEMTVRFDKDERVKMLARLVDQEMTAAKAPDKVAAPKAAADPAVKPAAVRAAANKNLPAERLRDEDINTIRVYEIEINTEPIVTVPREVMEKVFKAYSTSDLVPKGTQAQRSFLGEPGWRQLQLLFELKAREYYSKVTVKNDPIILKDFRVGIHQQYVINYCATSECHGGADAKKIFLFRNDPTSDKTVYTNYFILNSYKDAGGYMIDRDMPDRSYLLQYSLPLDVAKTPHPKVKGWQPAIRAGDAGRADALIKWVESLGKLRVDYPVDYHPPLPSKPAAAEAAPGAAPGGAGATVPAVPAPATQPAPAGAPGSPTPAAPATRPARLPR